MKSMNKIKLTLLALVLCGGSVAAQTVFDGELLTSKELSGTARYVGMGGALGALGADISTMGSNPAGIGLYRSNDFATTFSFRSNEVKSKYDGNSYKADKNKFGLGTMGFVISTHLNDYGLKYLNFGFNYNRASDFNRNFKSGGILPFYTDQNGNKIPISINLIGANQANMASKDGYDIASLVEEGKTIFDNPNIGWLGGLIYEGVLIEKDENGYFDYLPQADYELRSSERGGINQYDFNISGNISDRFFFGLTVGAYDINYRQYTYYDEGYESNEYGLIHTNREIDGSGVDFKLGAIFRPIESSPFRIGLAIHSPIYYNLTEYNDAMLESEIATDRDNPNSEILHSKIYTSDDLNGLPSAFDYKLRTPWKFNFSLGHNVGNTLALGAEYEYQDYSKMHFKSDYGSSLNFTNDTRSMLEGVHTLKLGGEYRIVPEFAFRLGYNIQSAIFKDDAYKDFPGNSTITDPQFMRLNDIRNTFTFGLGYSGQVFYTDLAFKFDHYKSEFKPFDHPELVAAQVTNNKSQILLTLGVRL